MTLLESKSATNGELRGLIERMLARTHLDVATAERALQLLTEPETTHAQQAAFLVALRAKGETAAEIVGLARALLARCIRPPVSARAEPLVDTCGTGGDGTHSFNLSTATALLVAALGLRVAKHGNRSVSSRCGSADLLEALGVPVPADAAGAARALEQHGFTFLFAPHFHPVMAALAGVRRELGVRTVFNLLGPLVNPARPTHQLLGAPSSESARLLARAASELGTERTFVVHGDGFDEATPCGPFLLLEAGPRGVEERRVDPRSYGCERCRAAELAGGDARENAERLRRLFRGERGPLRDALCLNAALVLELVGRARDPRAALRIAATALDDGRAERLLARLCAAGEPR